MKYLFVLKIKEKAHYPHLVIKNFTDNYLRLSYFLLLLNVQRIYKYVGKIRGKHLTIQSAIKSLPQEVFFYSSPTKTFMEYFLKNKFLPLNNQNIEGNDEKKFYKKKS